MEPLEKIKTEMDKVKAASFGEVILFLGSEIYISEKERGNPIFTAMLGIYRGISRDLCTYEVLESGEKVYRTLRPVYTVGLGITKVRRIYAPIFEDTEFSECMSLTERETAYVGPEDIAEVLKTEGKGFFDDFFQEYVKLYRKVKE